RGRLFETRHAVSVPRGAGATSTSTGGQRGIGRARTAGLALESRDTGETRWQPAKRRCAGAGSSRVWPCDFTFSPGLDSRVPVRHAAWRKTRYWRALTRIGFRRSSQDRRAERDTNSLPSGAGRDDSARFIDLCFELRRRFVFVSGPRTGERSL